MNGGEVQVIILLQLWHEIIYLLIMENLLLSEKPKAAVRPFKTLENLKAPENP